jgi:hypothetical protein
VILPIKEIIEASRTKLPCYNQIPSIAVMIVEFSVHYLLQGWLPGRDDDNHRIWGERSYLD